MDDSRGRGVLMFGIVIMSVKGSGWPPAPPLFNNPIITGSILTGDPCIAAARLNASHIHIVPHCAISVLILCTVRNLHMTERQHVPVTPGNPQQPSTVFMGTIFSVTVCEVTVRGFLRTHVLCHCYSLIVCWVRCLMLDNFFCLRDGAGRQQAGEHAGFKIRVSLLHG